MFINLCKEAAAPLGLRNRNDVVLYFFEAYSISKDKVRAGSGGMERTKGDEAFLSSLHLKLASREWLARANYTGHVFPWIISELLWDGALSWQGRGKELADVAGAGFGLIAHEFTHCFGTSNHNSVLDLEQSSEDLMGSGSRRMRAYFRPTLGTTCILSQRVANILDKSEFFAVRPLKPKSSAFG